MGLRERKQQRTRAAIVDAALRLFERQGFDATSVEQIAVAAEVAVRTFYRYFPAKEDVIFLDTEAEATLRRVLSERRPDESDARLAARAMYEALAVDQERVLRTRAILEATPALRQRAEQAVSRSSDLVAEHLIARGAANREARLRALIIARCVTTAVRTAFFAWIDGGRRGSGWRQCEKALDALRDALRD